MQAVRNKKDFRKIKNKHYKVPQIIKRQLKYQEQIMRKEALVNLMLTEHTEDKRNSKLFDKFE